MQKTWIWSLGREDPLENRVTAHSSVLAWEIPWTEEPGGLQSRRSQRVRHDWACILWRPPEYGLVSHISWIETPASQVSLVAISLTFSPYPSTGPKSWVILTKEGPRIYPLRKTLARRTGMKIGQLTARARLVPRCVEWVKKSTSPQFHWHFSEPHPGSLRSRIPR